MSTDAKALARTGPAREEFQKEPDVYQNIMIPRDCAVGPVYDPAASVTSPAGSK